MSIGTFRINPDLLITIAACYFLLRKGMNAILTVNAIVVPIMLLFTVLIMIDTFRTPGADKFITLASDHSIWAAWASPFLYTAFNLSMSQAVLVPLGAEINDRKVIIAGSWVGGIGIGFMLLAGHIALSVHMPGIQQFAIPMGGIARQLGPSVQFIYIFIIFAEIFTTLIADIYGLTLQLHERLEMGAQLDCPAHSRHLLRSQPNRLRHAALHALSAVWTDQLWLAYSDYSQACVCINSNQQDADLHQ